MSRLTSHSCTINQYTNSHFLLPSCKWLHSPQFSLGFVHEGFYSEGLFTSSGGRNKVTWHTNWNQVTILVNKLNCMMINMIWIFFFFWTNVASLKVIITITLHRSILKFWFHLDVKCKGINKYINVYYKLQNMLPILIFQYKYYIKTGGKNSKYLNNGHDQTLINSPINQWN